MTQGNFKRQNNSEIKVINGVPHRVEVEVIDDVSPEGYFMQREVHKYIPI